MRGPLALSDAQLDVVLDYARSVPVEWRDRFLHDIADRLTGLEQPNNDELQSAIHQSLSRMGVAA